MEVPQNRTHFLKAIPVPTGTHLTSWLIGSLWFPYFGLSYYIIITQEMSGICQ